MTGQKCRTAREAIKKALVVNEDEAQTIRLMYYMLLNGSSTAEIADTLNELQRETGRSKVIGKPNFHWTPNSVSAVMRNEKYKGDALMQKFYTEDFLTKRQIPNKGVLPQYYVEGNHECCT